MEEEKEYKIIGEANWICEDCKEDRHCFLLENRKNSNNLLLLCKDCIEKRGLKIVSKRKKRLFK